ncbi:hypothetical protein KSP40_PGU013076 [Platanthera guangdongensis]|uniref:Uncharacterized protein n=1 Tax=Platanthera guangdongensis TaxID=2320717 RepID=A0ABR2MFV4_9ASPA
MARPTLSASLFFHPLEVYGFCSRGLGKEWSAATADMLNVDVWARRIWAGWPANMAGVGMDRGMIGKGVSAKKSGDVTDLQIGVKSKSAARVAGTGGEGLVVEVDGEDRRLAVGFVEGIQFLEQGGGGQKATLNEAAGMTTLAVAHNGLGTAEGLDTGRQHRLRCGHRWRR